MVPKWLPIIFFGAILVASWLNLEVMAPYLGIGESAGFVAGARFYLSFITLFWLWSSLVILIWKNDDGT